MEQLPKLDFVVSEGEVVKVFTDGSCHPNNRSKKSKAGFSAVFVGGYLQDEIICEKLETHENYASNIRAEGMAIIAVLEKLDNRDTWDLWTRCEIYTDSKFWIDMIERYMPNWIKKGTKFISKKNPDLTTRLWKLHKYYKKNKKEIIFIHVYAHNKKGWKNSDDPYKSFCYENNECADVVANWARENL